MKQSRNIWGAAVGAALLVGVGLLAAGIVLVWMGQRGSEQAVAEPAAKAPTHEERLELVTAKGTYPLDVEVAATPEQQALGLMFRTHLADTKGMLFTHNGQRELTMWMRNTYIPLDMVFIRSDGIVHRIEAKTEPFSERIIASEGPVAAVLEIAGGAAERIGLKAGDKVRHRHFGSTPSR